MQINPVALLSKARTMKSTGTSHDHCTTTQKKIAFITNEERWTYERLASEVNRLATGLVERGVRQGDRLALHMANLPEFVIACEACFKVGAIAAPLNLRLKAAELGPLLQRLRPGRSHQIGYTGCGDPMLAKLIGRHFDYAFAGLFGFLFRFSHLKPR
jgi:acyl-CoA synthetase (AMP-forming)/AMP-acid ligase II